MIIHFKAKHKDTHILLSAKINNERNRFLSCLTKIGRLDYLTKKGEIGAVLELHAWNRTIHERDIYFSKEIKRLEKLVKRKTKSPISDYCYSGRCFRLPIKNSSEAKLYAFVMPPISQAAIKGEFSC